MALLVEGLIILTSTDRAIATSQVLRYLRMPDHSPPPTMLTDRDKWEEPAAINGYSDHSKINIATYISSNSLCLQNALEMLSKV